LPIDELTDLRAHQRHECFSQGGPAHPKSCGGADPGGAPGHVLPERRAFSAIFVRAERQDQRGWAALCGRPAGSEQGAHSSSALSIWIVTWPIRCLWRSPSATSVRKSPFAAGSGITRCTVSAVSVVLSGQMWRSCTPVTPESPAR